MPGFGGLSDSPLPSTSHDFRDGTTIASPQPAHVSPSPRRATDAIEIPARRMSAGDRTKNDRGLRELRELVLPAPTYMPSSPPQVPTYASVSPLRRARWKKNPADVVEHRERAMSDSTIRRVTPDPNRIGLAESDYSDSGDDGSLPSDNDYKALLSKLDSAQIDSDATAKDKAPVSGSDAAQIVSDAAAKGRASVNGPDTERTDLADGDCSDSDDDVPLPPINGDVADAIPHLEDYDVQLSKFDTAQFDSDATAKDEDPVDGSDDFTRLSAVGGPEHFTDELDYVLAKHDFWWAKNDHVDERVAGDVAAQDVGGHAVNGDHVHERVTGDVAAQDAGGHAVNGGHVHERVAEDVAADDVAADHVDERVAGDTAAHDAADHVNGNVVDEIGAEHATSHVTAHDAAAKDVFDDDDDEFDHERLMRDGIECSTSPPMPFHPHSQLDDPYDGIKKEITALRNELFARFTSTDRDSEKGVAIAHLNEQLDSTEDQLQQSNNALEMANASWRCAVEPLQQQLSWAREQLEQRDRTIGETMSAVAKEVTILRNEFSARDAEKSETIAELRQQLSSTQAQLQQRDCAIDAAKKETTSLRDEFGARDAKKEDIIAGLQVQLGVADDQNTSMRAKVKTLVGVKRDLEANTDGLHRKLMEKEEENRKMAKILLGTWGREEVGEAGTYRYRYHKKA